MVNTWKSNNHVVGAPPTRQTDWLSTFTGTVDQQLLLRNEYLVAMNRILKAPWPGRLRLSNAERARLV